MLLFIVFSLFLVVYFDFLDFILERIDLFREFVAFDFQLLFLAFHLGFLLLSLQSFSHSICNRALVQGLVSLYYPSSIFSVNKNEANNKINVM